MFELLLQADDAFARGSLDQAEQLYEQLVQLDPTSAMAIAGLARISLERGDEKMASALAERALAIDPESVVAVQVARALQRDPAGKPRGDSDHPAGDGRPMGRERVADVVPHFPSRPLEARRRAHLVSSASVAADVAARRRGPADPFAAAEAAAMIEAVDAFDEIADQVESGPPEPMNVADAAAPPSAASVVANVAEADAPAPPVPLPPRRHTAASEEEAEAEALREAFAIVLDGEDEIDAPAVATGSQPGASTQGSSIPAAAPDQDEEEALEEALAEMLGNDTIWEVASVTRSRAPLPRVAHNPSDAITSAAAEAQPSSTSVPAEKAEAETEDAGPETDGPDKPEPDKPEPVKPESGKPEQSAPRRKRGLFGRFGGR
jgi:tetratricopeptide (TPR) repeat protein